MTLGFSELSNANKVLPTPITTGTEGGMNTQFTADMHKGGKKIRKTKKNTKKSRKNKRKSRKMH